MKRSLLLLVLLSLFALSCLSFAQEVEVSVAINNQFIQDDSNHYLIDGQIYVVARIAAEAAGGVVTWMPETQELHIQYREKLIRLQVGNPVAYLNLVDINTEAPPTTALSTEAPTELPAEPSTETPAEVTTEIPTATSVTEGIKTEQAPLLKDQTEVILKKAPFIKDGKTYVPVEVVTDLFGMTAKWFEHSYTLHLSQDGVVVPEALVYQRPYNDVDLLWLARIIQAESPSGSQIKKMAVANVVLNRVKSPRFPNTVKEVIFAAGQFPPTKRTSFLSLVPSLESLIAAKRALEGNNPIEGCLFFNCRPFAGKQNDFYKKIEGDYFYR